MLVCALFFRAAAWRSFSKQGLGVREEVGVLRPWGDLRPAAAALEEALDGLLVLETFSEAPAGCSATLLSNASLFAPLARGIVGGSSNRYSPGCHRGLGLVEGAPRL
mmetsp:Transcript_16887/g.48144  ORF Transcript_16887/g.48144 Transcript_16887/m.48144 type:complete len:107 (-) Transcript_16887:17-337(-)